MIDILGDRLQIPLSADPPDPGDGSIRLYAHGESEAFQAGRPDSDDGQEYRRVDISANGGAVIRCTYASDASE
jgi:hypothetical protein